MKSSFAFIPGGLFLLNILMFQAGYPKFIHSASYKDPALSTPPNTLSRLQVDRDNPRHFADTLGNPVLLIGDSPQNLLQKLTVAQMKSYFADCRSKGINLCWVCIDGQPTDRAVESAPVSQLDDELGNLQQSLF